MRAVMRINPIYLLIGLNIVLVLFRDVILPEETALALATSIESTVLQLGVVGYVGIVVAYVICGFFFVPLLIPLNILGGALYGAYVGTAVALAGITLGCVASTISARYVFTGMQKMIERKPRLRRLLDRADNHRNLAIVMVRFAVVIPYLLQNIALAVTNTSTTRITLVTAVSALPGAAIYSFLGAGLVQAQDAREMVMYLSVPVLMMLLVTGGLAWFKRKYDKGEASD